MGWKCRLVRWMRLWFCVKRWNARREMSRQHRNIEEEFRAIAPPGRRGIPGAQPIIVGVTGIGGAGSASNAPQITVNVNAMDSQSFMDRSGYIASAVREAMLNLHPINDVVASL